MSDNKGATSRLYQGYTVYCNIPSTYYLRFYDHVVVLVCVGVLVLQKIGKTHRAHIVTIFKSGVNTAVKVYACAPPRTIYSYAGFIQWPAEIPHCLGFYMDPSNVVPVRISRTSFKSILKLTFCCWKPC